MENGLIGGFDFLVCSKKGYVGVNGYYSTTFYFEGWAV
jgi:hypothetical protein